MKIGFLIDYDSTYIHICTTSNKHCGRAAANPALYSGVLSSNLASTSASLNRPLLCSVTQHNTAAVQQIKPGQSSKFHFNPLCTNYAQKKNLIPVPLYKP